MNKNTNFMFKMKIFNGKSAKRDEILNMITNSGYIVTVSSRMIATDYRLLKFLSPQTIGLRPN